MTDGRALAEALRKSVVGIGGGFMTSPEAKAAGKDGGYRGWAFYMGGRAGVLGPAPADVVSAALGFFEPEMVRANWERALTTRPVEETVQRYVDACRLWGRNRYEALDGVERLADLLDAVVQGVEPAGLPLFAGWHAVPLPDDAPARVAQLMQVLREHRGGAHVMGVRAAGLSPLEAVLGGDEGVPNAQFFGWPDPYPEIDDGGAVAAGPGRVDDHRGRGPRIRGPDGIRSGRAGHAGGRGRATRARDRGLTRAPSKPGCRNALLMPPWTG